VRARAHYGEGVYRLDAIVQKLTTVGSAADLPVQGDDSPRAAVAAILREGGEGAEVFFIRRAESPTDPWSGHIAFPGGRHEPEDESLLVTAIRETREEVGIDLARAELIARLPDVPAFIRSKRGRLVVTPFVFAMREDVAPTLNYEVAGTLWVPLARLARGEGKGTYAFVWEDAPYELPCYRLEPDQHVLWGMTHRMLESMLEALA
jgi:8-oxo-dGTP pyrophosphatase MutT (NUDIX family)